MAERRLELFKHASDTAQKWVNELDEDLEWSDHHKTFRLLRATLHALRDWLQITEAAQLSAQLPTLIRGLYYEGWKPQTTPPHPHTCDAFLTRIAVEISPEVIWGVEEAVSTVFRFLGRHVSQGEISDIRAALPADLRSLWK